MNRPGRNITVIPWAPQQPLILPASELPYKLSGLQLEYLAAGAATPSRWLYIDFDEGKVARVFRLVLAQMNDGVTTNVSAAPNLPAQNDNLDATNYVVTRPLPIGYIVESETLVTLAIQNVDGGDSSNGLTIVRDFIAPRRETGKR